MIAPGPDGISFGILHKLEHNYSATAITDVKVYQLSRSFFNEYTNILDDLAKLWNHATMTQKHNAPSNVNDYEKKTSSHHNKL